MMGKSCVCCTRVAERISACIRCFMQEKLCIWSSEQQGQTPVGEGLRWVCQNSSGTVSGGAAGTGSGGAA